MVDYLAQLKRTLDYIEENLSQKVGFRDMASQAAAMSPWHFLRVFEAVLGLSPTDYLRERRLTAAALRLVESSERILDIALDAGYESHEAFTRSFTKRFGMGPARYRERREQASLLVRKPLTLEALRQLTEGQFMEPRIEEKETITLVGLSGPTSMANNRIPALWQTFLPRLSEIEDRKPGSGSYGVCAWVSPKELTEDVEWDELVAVETKSYPRVPEGMTSRILEGRKYAVFTHRGTLDTLGNTYDHIYKTWLPRSGLSLAEAADFEYYDDRFDPASPDSEMEIWVPLA